MPARRIATQIGHEALSYRPHGCAFQSFAFQVFLFHLLPAPTQPCLLPYFLRFVFQSAIQDCNAARRRKHASLTISDSTTPLSVTTLSDFSRVACQ